MTTPSRSRRQPRFEPSFRTPIDQQDKVEAAKRSTRLVGTLDRELRDDRADLGWESEQIAKSHGLYLQFDRADSGEEKHWIYMLRIGVPGGQRISPEQWQLLHELSEDWSRHPDGSTSLRLTTRGNIQFHWLSKRGVLDVVKRLAESGLYSRNACGDNVRSVMACPLSGSDSTAGGFDVHGLARAIAATFALPDEPFARVFAVDPARLREGPDRTRRYRYGDNLLNRKFKIGVARLARAESGALIYDDCVEVRTQDVGILPIPSGDDPHRIERVQILVGGGQGERKGKTTASLLGLPFADVPVTDVVAALEGIVRVQETFGDRAHRHWARLKYLVRAQGIDWLRARVAAESTATFEPPTPASALPPTEPHRHIGHMQQSDGRHAFGMFVENGRLTDASPNGRIKSAVARVVEQLGVSVTPTPGQDLAFVDLRATEAERVEAILHDHGYGQRRGRAYSRLRLGSGACVGLDTCRLSYTDSEKFEPELIDELERRGFGDIATTLGITGCERQCYRPATKAIGLVGSGKSSYLVKLFGTESGRHQGQPLIVDDRAYLTEVPREDVADLLTTILEHYRSTARPDESLGKFLRRMGPEALLAHLRADPRLDRLGTQLTLGRPWTDVPSASAFYRALDEWHSRRATTAGSAT